MATPVTIYTDTGVVGGAADGTSWANAYSALNTASAAEGKDITQAGGTDEKYIFICRASTGVADTSVPNFGGANNWVTDLSDDNTIEIYASDFPASGRQDWTKYHLYNNNSATNSTCVFGTNAATLHHMQIRVVSTDNDRPRRGVYITNQDAENLISVHHCIIIGEISGAAADINCGVLVNDAQANVNCWDVTSSGFVNGAPAMYGFWSNTCTTFNVWNCVSYGNAVGCGRFTAGTMTVKNSMVGNNANDFTVDMTIDYCMSDDGDGGNPIAVLGGDWDNEMTDPDNGDFRIIPTGNGYGAGVNDPGGGLYSTDIADAAYEVDNWSVGAYQDRPSSGVAVNVLIIGSDF